MKTIQILSLAGLATALTASASASNYSVAQRFTWPSQAGKSSTIAATAHGQGVGRQKKGAPETEPLEHPTPRHGTHRWR